MSDTYANKAAKNVITRRRRLMFRIFLTPTNVISEATANNTEWKKNASIIPALKGDSSRDKQATRHIRNVILSRFSGRLFEASFS